MKLKTGLNLLDVVVVSLLTLNIITSCSSVSTVNFVQVNASWDGFQVKKP